ncbi:RNase H domain-containing protein [Histoplasma capsulatum var. duboisii H88]|uniref:ribonuclease H n=1 Tax=Ajellomyces capsulatus (strain H88) TaxID=544711 RepID=F0UMB1_AJEC8|nr:RNase H domain-containing protein [Histoplasma capsulatum var. duboisii H88]QSS54248.1 RNase H domain-containing protein [Histoplasma capsulatum var. duboisii H88]
MAAITPSPAANDTKTASTPASPVESTTSQPVGAKRKRTAEPKFYAVKFGFQPGVYHTWNDCLTQVTGFKGAVFQSFPTLDEANAFLTGTQTATGHGNSSTSTKFYGVQRGRKPGVYTDWAVTQDQVRGFRGPKYRRFATWAEADAYVRQGQQMPEETEVAQDVEHNPNPSGKTNLPGAPGLTSERPTDVDGKEYPPGLGPVPPGAVDGFDPNVLLDPTTGKLKYRSPHEKVPTKQQPGRPGPLKIYTDGSSLRNGSMGAKAGVGVYFGPGDERNVSEPLKGSRQTNQRAELTAIIRALDIAPRHRDVTIFTDSKYAINCVTVWFVNWQRNKWMTAQDKPVENKDLIQSILLKIEERTLLNVKTLFEWVRGHSQNPGNEAADRLAVNGAKNGPLASNDIATPEPEDYGGGIRGSGGDNIDEVGERTEGDD